MRRRFGILVASFVMPLVAACTSILGDFSTGPGGTDASTSGDAKTEAGDAKGGSEGGGGDAAGGVKAVASGGSVYVKQRATVDGSMSTSSNGAPTFSWTFVSFPTGSNVAATLLGAGTSKATFVPDLPGDYKLQLLVAHGIHHAVADATVHAIAPQVFYLEGATTVDGGLSNDSPDASGTITYYAVDYDGKNARAVTCPNIQPVQLGIGEVGLFGGVGYDFWEGEAGTPPKFAAFQVGVDVDSGGYATRLYSGTSASSCDGGPPVDLGFFPEATMGLQPYAMNPRISPDGSQIAFIDQNSNVETVATDGSSAAIVVAPYFDGSDAAVGAAFDPGPLELVPPRPQWLGTTDVAWARPSPAGWEVVTAPNSAAATVSVYMSCSGVTPRQFAFLPSGNVLVSYRFSSSSPENLYQLDKHCTAVQTYTDLSASPASVASDFSVSPDGKTIAFLEADPAKNDAGPFGLSGVGGYLYIVPVDNSVAPSSVGSRPVLSGPQWIGGGTLLVITRDDGTPTSTAELLATSVAVVSPDASFAATVVAKGDGIATTVTTSGNGACSIGGRAAGPGAFSLLSLAAVAHLVRRRKRREV